MSLGANRLRFSVAKQAVTDAPLAASGNTVRLLSYELDKDGKPIGSPDILFVGEVLEVSPIGTAQSARDSYECVNAWVYLERTTFYQDWDSIAGTSAGSTLVCLFMNTETILGAPAPGYPGGYPHLPGTKLITVGRQIYDAVNWLRTELGAPIQLGQAAADVEPKDLCLPVVQKFDIKVWEALRVGLEKSPDVVSYFDYSTTPPSIYFKRRADLPAVTQTIALEGSSSTSETKQFAGQTVAPADLAWWKSCAPKLRDAMKIDQSDASAITFTDTALNPDDYDAGKWYSTGWTCQELDTGNLTPTDIRETVRTGWYRVTEGEVPQWLIEDGTYAVKRVRFYAVMEIEYRNGSIKMEPIHFECILTNCPPGSYTLPTSYTAAEPIPEGLAEQVQKALGQVYHEGSVTIREQFPTGQVSVGQVVNLVGKDGETRFSTMRALVQKVTVNYDTGTTVVDFGLPRWLGIAELVDLFRNSRGRVRRVNPAGMGDGTKLGGGGESRSSDGQGNDNLTPGEALEFTRVIESADDRETNVTMTGGKSATSTPPSAKVVWKGKTVAKLSAGSNRGILSLLAAAEGAEPVEKALIRALEAGGKAVLTGNGSVDIDSSLG